MNDKQNDSEHARLKSEYDRWNWEINLFTAQRAHDRDQRDAELASKATIESGALILRALVWINGGAAITLLTLLGSIVATDKKEFIASLEWATTPLVWFAIGVGLAVAAMGTTYLANLSYSASKSYHEYKNEHPYINYDTVGSKWWSRLGIGFHKIAVVIAFSSLVCFICGLLAVQSAFSALV